MIWCGGDLACGRLPVGFVDSFLPRLGHPRRFGFQRRERTRLTLVGGERNFHHGGIGVLPDGPDDLRHVGGSTAEWNPWVPTRGSGRGPRVNLHSRMKVRDSRKPRHRTRRPPPKKHAPCMLLEREWVPAWLSPVGFPGSDPPSPPSSSLSCRGWVGGRRCGGCLARHGAVRATTRPRASRCEQRPSAGHVQYQPRWSRPST